MARFIRFCNSFAFATVAGIGAILLWSCSQAAPPAEPKTGKFNPECPVTSITYRDSGGDSLIARTKLSLPGPNTLVPEYNDCQRFVINGGHEYGALVGVFARESLDRWVARVDTLALKGTAAKAVAVAQLLDYNSTLGYHDLDIDPGFNCLYMYGVVVGKKVERHAFMLPVQDSEQLCLTEMTPPIERLDRLSVIPVSFSDYTVGDYVPAARWDWDPDRKVQYIAIGCRDSYCDIVPSGQHTASPARDNTTQSKHGRRFMRIKPWYDEELLAVAGSGPYGLIPSTVTGTLIADSSLVDMTVDSFKVWRRVAGAALSDSNFVYKQKFNFDKSPNMKQLNRIDMCMGTQQDCHVPATANVTPCPNTGDPWWARVTAVGGTVAYRCVERRKHIGPSGKSLIIPGIVRWRWTINDQGSVWIECPDGCCEIHGKP